jgi:hypothetical protein
MPDNLSHVPGRFVFATDVCRALLRPSKKQKTAWNFPRKCSPGEKKKQMHGRAGTERGAPANTRALDSPKTAADRKHERSQACRRQLHGGTLVCRGRLLEFSPSALLRGNAAVIEDGEARTLHAVFAVDDCGVYVRARSLSCLCKYCVCVISLSLFPLFPL